MIVFDRLWHLVKERDMSIYQLREKCGLDNKTIQRLRANENTETKTLDKICNGLHCTLQDIMEHIPD